MSNDVEIELWDIWHWEQHVAKDQRGDAEQLAGIVGQS